MSEKYAILQSIRALLFYCRLSCLKTRFMFLKGPIKRVRKYANNLIYCILNANKLISWHLKFFFANYVSTVSVFRIDQLFRFFVSINCFGFSYRSTVSIFRIDQLFWSFVSINGFGFSYRSTISVFRIDQLFQFFVSINCFGFPYRSTVSVFRIDQLIRFFVSINCFSFSYR